MGEEKSFEKKVKRFFDEKGCWVLKTCGSGFQRAGIPDLLVCYKGKFLAIELKSNTGKLSKLQEIELGRINTSGGIAICLKPDKFEDFKKYIEEL